MTKCPGRRLWRLLSRRMHSSMELMLRFRSPQQFSDRHARNNPQESREPKMLRQAHFRMPTLAMHSENTSKRRRLKRDGPAQERESMGIKSKCGIVDLRIYGRSCTWATTCRDCRVHSGRALPPNWKSSTVEETFVETQRTETDQSA